MQELERFLEALNHQLYPISISERSHILIKLNKEILQRLEDNPNIDIHHVLKSLGSVQQIAKTHLLEKGFTNQTIKQIKRSNKHPLIRMFLGFILAFLILFISSIALIIWKFTPIFKIDENSGRVIILGGLIDVEPDPGSFAFANNIANKYEGELPMLSRNIDKLKITFSNAQFTFNNTSTDSIRWKCKFIPAIQDSTPTIEEIDQQIVMNFNNTKGSKCNFDVPKNIWLSINGINGKIKVEKAHYNINATLNNGKISFTPDQSSNYDISTNVTNGTTDAFTSIKDNNAFKVNFAVLNGKISNI